MSPVGQLASRSLFSESCEDIGLDSDGDHLFGDAASGCTARTTRGTQIVVCELRNVREIDIMISRLARA
jgi:hypothetical protein